MPITPNIDDQLQRIRQIDQGKPRKRVAILGAGMAGLAAGHELEALGHTVEILEANPQRVGGRVRTHRFSDGTYGELGAMRIPVHHHYTRHYIRKLGLKLRTFVSAHQNLKCFYNIRGIHTRIDNAKTNLYPNFELSADQRNYPIPPVMFGKALGGIVESLTDDEKESLLTEELATDRLRDLDRTTLGEFLRVHTGADASILLGCATGLESFFDKAVTMFLRDAVQDEGDHLDEIVGGMDELPNRLSQTIRGRIRMGVRVDAISRDGSEIIVSTSSEDQRLEPRREQYVLCTLPFSILRHMELDFSPEKMRAIRSLGYGSSTKVLLHCTERFWESKYGIIGGASMMDLPTRATYYPSDVVGEALEEAVQPTPTTQYSTLYNPRAVIRVSAAHIETAKQRRPGVLLGSYTWGQEARRMGALSRTERKGLVVDNIAQIHPEIKDPGIVDDDASIFWDSYEYTRGAFSFLNPGDQISLYPHTFTPEGSVFFAGEHCSLENAWIQGALISALRAVEQIVSR